MDICNTEASRHIYDLLYTRDFSQDNLKAALDTGKFTPEDVNRAALAYVEACRWEFYDEPDDEPACAPGELRPGCCSTHMVEAISLLLEYGLDPNAKFMDEYGEYNNIMGSLCDVCNGYVGPDALALLLAHGGDLTMELHEGDSLIGELDFDVLFGLLELPNRSLYDVWVHCWLVAIGYGVTVNGKPLADMRGSHQAEELKNHRNYYIGVIHDPASKDGWSLCIFDKVGNWEVARC